MGKQGATQGGNAGQDEGEIEISIVEVAKHAGVSIATVSRVLNDVPVVNPKTVEAVRRAVQELGYHPLRAKKTPKGGKRNPRLPQLRSNQIAVLAIGGSQQWFHMPVMASVLSGITRAAREYDLRLMLDELPADSVDIPTARLKEMAGAVAFVQPHVEENLLVDLSSRVPLVWAMGGQSHRSVVDHVTADNIGIGYAAFDHLAKKQCEHFSFITDTPEWPMMRSRGQAFANAARDQGKSVSSYIVSTNAVQAAAYGPQTKGGKSLDEAVASLAKSLKPGTGLFIPTDLLATRVYPLLQQAGVKPMQDVQVISCDNEEPRLSLLNPRPPSIDLGAEDIGRAAVRQLMSRIAMPDAPIVRVQVSPRVSHL